MAHGMAIVQSPKLILEADTSRNREILQEEQGLFHDIRLCMHLCVDVCVAPSLSVYLYTSLALSLSALHLPFASVMTAPHFHEVLVESLSKATLEICPPSG